jgi:hypothetical protein
MAEAALAAGARIECRSAEWLVRRLGRTSHGQQVVDVVGAAGSFKVLQPELEAQRERLRRLRGRQVEQLQRSLAADQRPQPIQEKHRLAAQKAIEERFNDHERFVADVMTIEAAPYLKLVAVLHREA